MDNIITEEVVNAFLEGNEELKIFFERRKIDHSPSLDAPFHMLTRAIVGQQLSTKAAKAIYLRIEELLGEITAENILKYTPEELKAVGLSLNKAKYIQNVANAFKEGGHLEKYNDLEMLQGLSSEEIIDMFTVIKGVGEWTVQMYLIFSLGKLDIIAVNDLGVRKGVKKMYGLEETPSVKEMKEITKSWQPHGTIGSLLAWNLLDENEDDALIK